MGTLAGLPTELILFDGRSRSGCLPGRMSIVWSTGPELAHERPCPGAPRPRVPPHRLVDRHRETGPDGRRGPAYRCREPALRPHLLHTPACAASPNCVQLLDAAHNGPDRNPAYGVREIGHGATISLDPIPSVPVMGTPLPVPLPPGASVTCAKGASCRLPRSERSPARSSTAQGAASRRSPCRRGTCSSPVPLPVPTRITARRTRVRPRPDGSDACARPACSEEAPAATAAARDRRRARQSGP